MWLEFKIDFVKHWWLYAITLFLFVSIPIWFYRAIIYEPKVDYSNSDFSQYMVDHRSPVEIMEDELKKGKEEDAKKTKDGKSEIKKSKSKEETLSEDYNGGSEDKISAKGRDVSIKVDYNRGIYKYYSINKDERWYLREHGYQVAKFKSIMSDKKEKYMLKPRFNESALHFFVIIDIKQFLESQNIEVKLFTTKKPDLIFYINGKSYAIEVETGSVLKRSSQKIIEKMKVIEKEYDYGFIVVPTRKMVQKYRKIVPALDYRYLKNKLTRIIKNSKNKRI